MKVCHVNFARGYRGGERQTELLVRGLADVGIEQRLIVRHDSPLRARLRGVPRLDIVGLRQPFLLQPWAVRGCTLTHAHEANAAHYAHLAYRFGGPRYVITRRVTKRPKMSPETRAVYRQAARVIAISSAIERVIREYSPETSIACIPSMAGHLPVNVATLSAIRQRFAGDYLLVQIGALKCREKGQHVLLEALRRAERPEIRVVFVGEGRDRAALEAQAADLPRVTFTGFVDDVANWIAASDVVVQPSLIEEGLGSTLLDAMEHGRPVIASGAGGVLDVVVHGETGLLVPPGDAAALAAAIRRLHGDRSLADALAAAGRERVRAMFLPETVVRRTLDEYHTCVEGHARAAAAHISRSA